MPDAAPSARPQAPRTDELLSSGRCFNCGAAVDRKFCPECGQAVGSPCPRFRDLVREAWQEMMQIDSKLVRTVVSLVVRPGFLTREYVAGKRVRYLSPFKMYLVVAALFFALGAWEGAREVKRAAAEPRAAAAAHTAQAAASEDDDPAVPDEEAARPEHVRLTVAGNEVQWDQLPASVAEYRQAQAALPPEKRQAPMERRITEHLIVLKEKSATGKAELVASVIGYFPYMMFCLLPVFALLLQLLYLRGRRLYVEHLVFALHLHTVFFIVATLSLGLGVRTIHGLVERLVPVGQVQAVLWIGFALYGFLAARRVYRQGLLKTLVKGGFLATTYVLVLACGIGITTLIALALLSSPE